MEASKLAALASRLHVVVESSPPSSAELGRIRKAIDRRLLVLQTSTSKKSQSEYQELTLARVQLPGTELLALDTKQQMVKVPAGVLERWIAKGEPPTPPESSAAKKIRTAAKSVARMQTQYASAATKANSDFRRARAIPLGSLSALAAALWGTRAALDIQIPHINWGVWSWGCGVVLAASLGFLLLSAYFQERAESWLRHLYESDVQAEALYDSGTKYWNGYDHSYRGRRHRLPLQSWFTSQEYANALYREAWVKATFSRYPNPWQPFDYTARRLVRMFSTIDLAGAVTDAAERALDRFVQLSVLQTAIDRGEVHYSLVDAEGVSGLPDSTDGPNDAG
jgi:hypothetical protein